MEAQNVAPYQAAAAANSADGRAAKRRRLSAGRGRRTETPLPATIWTTILEELDYPSRSALASTCHELRGCAAATILRLQAWPLPLEFALRACAAFPSLKWLAVGGDGARPAHHDTDGQGVLLRAAGAAVPKLELLEVAGLARAAHALLIALQARGPGPKPFQALTELRFTRLPSGAPAPMYQNHMPGSVTVIGPTGLSALGAHLPRLAHLTLEGMQLPADAASAHPRPLASFAALRDLRLEFVDAATSVWLLQGAPPLTRLSLHMMRTKALAALDEPPAVGVAAAGAQPVPAAAAPAAAQAPVAAQPLAAAQVPVVAAGDVEMAEAVGKKGRTKRKGPKATADALMTLEQLLRLEGLELTCCQQLTSLAPPGVVLPALRVLSIAKSRLLVAGLDFAVTPSLRRLAVGHGGAGVASRSLPAAFEGLSALPDLEEIEINNWLLATFSKKPHHGGDPAQFDAFARLARSCGRLRRLQMRGFLDLRLGPEVALLTRLEDLEIGGAGPFVIAPGFADALLGIKTLSRVVLGPPCMLPENLEQVKQICLAAEAPGRGLEVLYDHDDARQTQDW